MTTSPRSIVLQVAVVLTALLAAEAAAAEPCPPGEWPPQRNPTASELRCRFGVQGPGRFGLLSYLDVPVYQPATPMPGTHLVGVPGHAGPAEGESYEEWEWRILRTEFGPEARRVHRSLETMHIFAASRVMRFEAMLREAGVRAVRRETWRSPERQAHLFQQGRSRPGPIATATLTSWHSQVDEDGRPAGRAADYDVPASQLERFHEIAHSVGLASFGADSHDPGHVFLPDPEFVRSDDVVLLRTLPRVPVVTLATGLPVDRALPGGGRAELRERVLEFVSLPFLRPRVVERAREVPEIVRPAARSRAAAPASGDAPGARPRRGSS